MIEKEYDLHKHNIKTAEELSYFLDSIFNEAYAENFKLIRIITGRGVNSKNLPLLKPATEKYLKKCKYVSAFKLDQSLGAFEILLIN
jgi:DNA-nicking Smr family endonuclease